MEDWRTYRQHIAIFIEKYKPYSNKNERFIRNRNHLRNHSEERTSPPRVKCHPLQSRTHACRKLAPARAHPPILFVADSKANCTPTPNPLPPCHSLRIITVPPVLRLPPCSSSSYHFRNPTRNPFLILYFYINHWSMRVPHLLSPKSPHEEKSPTADHRSLCSRPSFPVPLKDA
jgi:hypothetical protein